MKYNLLSPFLVALFFGRNVAQQQLPTEKLFDDSNGRAAQPCLLDEKCLTCQGCDGGACSTKEEHPGWVNTNQFCGQPQPDLTCHCFKMDDNTTTTTSSPPGDCQDNWCSWYMLELGYDGYRCVPPQDTWHPYGVSCGVITMRGDGDQPREQPCQEPCSCCKRCVDFSCQVNGTVGICSGEQNPPSAVHQITNVTCDSEGLCLCWILLDTECPNKGQPCTLNNGTVGLCSGNGDPPSPDHQMTDEKCHGATDLCNCWIKPEDDNCGYCVEEMNSSDYQCIPPEDQWHPYGVECVMDQTLCQGTCSCCKRCVDLTCQVNGKAGICSGKHNPPSDQHQMSNVTCDNDGLCHCWIIPSLPCCPKDPVCEVDLHGFCLDSDIPPHHYEVSDHKCKSLDETVSDCSCMIPKCHNETCTGNCYRAHEDIPQGYEYQGPCDKDIGCHCYKYNCTDPKCEQEYGLCLMPKDEIPPYYEESCEWCNEKEKCRCYKPKCKETSKCKDLGGRCFMHGMDIPQGWYVAKSNGKDVYCKKTLDCKCYIQYILA